MPVNWDLLGPPQPVGEVVRQGFELGRAMKRRGVQESAFARLARNPRDSGAIAAIGAFDPVMAGRLREDARQGQFRDAFGQAYEPTTGKLDPVKARAAYVGVGDIEGAVNFDRQQAASEEARRAAAMKQLKDVAALLDDVTDEESFQRGRQVAAEMGLDVSRIPQTYDPDWVERQKVIARTFIEKPGELTSFQRELASAGIEPGSEDYRRLLENRYARPQLVRDAHGNVFAFGGTEGGGDTDAVFEALIAQESGGRAGIAGPVTEYGQPMGMTQMLPETAREMAAKVGLPWRPELLSGTTPEAAAYQRRLGRAYFDEGLERYGGDRRKALMYYHGGPDEAKWGPKTRAYADAVLGRVGEAPPAGRNLTKIADGKPPARPQPSTTRVVRGKTYYKVNGRWFDNPEGS